MYMDIEGDPAITAGFGHQSSSTMKDMYGIFQADPPSKQNRYALEKSISEQEMNNSIKDSTI